MSLRPSALALVVATSALAVLAGPTVTAAPVDPLGGSTPPASTTPTGGSAKPIAPPPTRAKIDPNLQAVLAFRARFGKTAPGYRPSERLERDGVLPVTIRFTTPPDDARVAALTTRGVEWERGAVPYASGVVGAKVSAVGVAALSADPTVVRVEIDLPREVPRPLDGSATETGVDAVRRSFRAKDGTLLDGKGVRIVDIDSGCFVFHPAFFKPDAGRLPWVDVNGDGAFTPDVDGVDLDASGTIEAAEVLHVLTATGIAHAGFVPALDYLYLDTNGNGKRDFGAGFDETTPAYGEPVFVADDVDADAVVAPTEKLLRLGTSKIAMARGSRNYTRGAAPYGILDYGKAVTKTDATIADSGHGTGVAGILVGGVPDRSRLLGLAPGADLLTVGYSGRDPTGTLGSVQWAIDQKADIILTEYAPYTGYPLDGSSEEEQLLDAAVDKGIAVVDPAGNLSTGFKHRTVSLPIGKTDLALRTDTYFRGSPYIALTVLHRGAAKLTGKLLLPGGASLDIPTDSTGDFTPVGDDRYLNVVRETSPRGTHQIHLQLYRYTDTGTLPLPSGDWTLSLESDTATEIDAYAGDAYNSWAYGFVFDKNTPNRTICHPATNDKGLTVAAYVLHGEKEYQPFGKQGELAGYSSLGPRLDGVAGIDLAAPDNPFSTAAPGKLTQLFDVLYDPFGGTSGAGPHVVAALALIKQVHPELSGAALQAALLDHTRKDAFVTDDANKWGKGKLDLAAALGVPRKVGSPPTVKLTASEKPQVGRPITLTAQIDDDAPGSKVRWDLDDDGKVDTEWSTTTTQQLSVDAESKRVVRVEVLDADGYLRGASMALVVGPYVADPVAPAETSGCGCRTTPRAPSAWPWALLALGLLARARKR
ncbi:MAG: S8 family serine peptidase [Myxococcales bacterium]|nr:S8 family serine peptidase [Myxococcales bacterium]